jgi:hypothetical protein
LLVFVFLVHVLGAGWCKVFVGLFLVSTPLQDALDPVGEAVSRRFSGRE